MAIRIEFQIIGINTGLESRQCFIVDEKDVPVDLTELLELQHYVTTASGEKGSERYTLAMALEQYLGLAPRQCYHEYMLTDESQHGMLAHCEITDPSVIGSFDLDDDTFSPDILVVGYI